MVIINTSAWVQQVFDSSSNLCTKKELEEQARVATKAFIDNDVNYDGSLTLDELIKLCNNLGLAVGNDDEEVLQKVNSYIIIKNIIFIFNNIFNIMLD
jgi:hypothetical protein